MKIKKIKGYGLAVLMSAFALGFSGCASTAVSVPEQPFVVVKGMLAVDLVEAIGEPLEVRPYDSGIEGAELWIYQKSNIDTKMVSTDLEEQLYIDPISGRESTVYVNVMNSETKVSEVKTIFLVINGKVEAWKVEQDERSYL